MPTLLYKNALCTWADPQRSERRPKKLWLEPCTSWRFATKQIKDINACAGIRTFSSFVDISQRAQRTRVYILRQGRNTQNYPCEGSGSREMKQREEGGRGGGGSHAFQVAGGKNFFFFSW